MSHAITHPHPPYLDVGLRWVARGVGACTVGLFTMIAAGEGMQPLLLSRSEMLMFSALFVALAGLVIAWRHEGLGGAMSVAGVMAFYLLNFAARGRFPGGFFFPMMFLPGLLFLACWWRSGRI
jgi:hypothetical protein